MEKDIYIQMIADELTKLRINRPSISRTIHRQMIDEGRELEASTIIFDRLCYGIKEGKALTQLCASIGSVLIPKFHDSEISKGKVIKFGSHMVDAAAKAKLITIKKYRIMENKGHQQWFVASADKDFTEFVVSRYVPTLRADNGPTEWLNHTLKVNGVSIPIVKNMKHYSMQHHYTIDQMPEVYNALNKLNRTTWKVNKDMFRLLSEARESEIDSFITPNITDKQKDSALARINKTNRVALWLSEVKFKLFIDQGYAVNKATSFAAKEINEFKKVKQFEPLNVISQWSKRAEQTSVMSIAKHYLDKDLNFIYNCDTRGRSYCTQQFLSPQGSDIAKALLCFSNPKPVSTYDLMITIANHAGQDKVSYADRVQWVQDNQDMIYNVGSNPWSSLSLNWLIENGIDRESKSKLQFIAACNEYAKLLDWIADGNNQDEFLSHISVGWDATNSGLQILSLLGRDETIAPYVNIVNTPKPGDIYQYIGDIVAKTHDIKKLREFNSGEKIWRKICKRNVMTKCYAATRRGMGDQHWEDRKTYGNPITDSLKISECNRLGEVVYDTCIKELPKASELMQTYKDVVNTSKSPLVTWRLPNGFTAFQYKSVSKDNGIYCSIDGIDIKLKYYYDTGISNPLKHQYGIAPNITHSYDAWLLMGIVNDMPEDANLHFIHDQFSTDSCYGSTIQECAKVNYEIIGSRTILKAILEQVAGEPVELPKPGLMKLEDVRSAEYIVC